MISDERYASSSRVNRYAFLDILARSSTLKSGVAAVGLSYGCTVRVCPDLAVPIGNLIRTGRFPSVRSCRSAGLPSFRVQET